MTGDSSPTQPGAVSAQRCPRHSAAAEPQPAVRGAAEGRSSARSRGDRRRHPPAFEL